MTHLDEQNLLLYAYGEVVEADARGIEEHLASCLACRRELETVERGRVLTDLAFARRFSGRSRIIPAAASVLAVAVVIALIVLIPARERGPQPESVSSSFTSRYITGGADLVAVDSMLSRLEQEVSRATR